MVLSLVAVVVGLVTFALTRPEAPTATVAPAPGTSPAVATLATVPAATFDEVGGTAPGTTLTPPTVAPAGAAALTQAGKPEVLFVGSEFCPFCAAQRWPLVVALLRFGTFSVLHDSVSAADSVFPSLQTFTFDAVRYSSPYLSFVGVEQYANQVGPDGTFLPLDSLTPSQAALVATAGPQTGAAPAGTTPVTDIGGRMTAVGSGYSPALLAGLSQGQIASQIAAPAPLPMKGDPPPASPPTGRAIVAVANQLTAGICLATGQQPAKVCRTPGVRQAAAGLGISGP